MVREAPQPGPQDFLDVKIRFGTGPGGSLLCAFIEGLVELVEAAFTPKLLRPEQSLDESVSKF